MLCSPVIEFRSRLMKTRRAEERGTGGKRGSEGLSERGWGVREGGEKLCLLFYSCLEDMAHARLPNPTGNGEPRGKGKTNKGSGAGGSRGRRLRWVYVWMEGMGGGGVNRVQGLCVRWCSVGELLMFQLPQSR